MGLAREIEARAVFFALPFVVRDKLRGYKERIHVLEDRFNIKIKHGDHTPDAVGILDRTIALMRSCRVRIFDVTTLTPNVMFEFGVAKGANLENLCLVRRRGTAMVIRPLGSGPPLGMSSDRMEKADGKEALQAGGDRCEAPAG